MEVGDLVDFLGMQATIKYIGPFHAKEGTWVGVELPLPKGKNNGTIKGKQYFECPENHGVFVQEDVFLGALAKSRKQAAAKKRTLHPQEMTMTPSSSDTNLASLNSPSQSSMIRSESVVLPQVQRALFVSAQENTEEQQTIEKENNSSQDFSLDDEISSAKAQIEYLANQYQNEKRQYEQLRTQYMQSEASYKEKVAQFKAKFAQTVQQMSIKNMQKILSVEEQILANVFEEKKLQKITISSAVRQRIELLTKINEEHNIHEKELRQMSKKYGDSMNAKITIKNSLEKKLQKYIILTKDRIEEEERLQSQIMKLDSEFEDQKPMWQESKSLRLQIEQINEIRSKHEQRLESYIAQQNEMNSFMESLIPLSKPVFYSLLLIKRIKQKLLLLEKTSENELLLHFCDCAEFFLSYEITDVDHLVELNAELAKIEKEINEFKPITANVDLLNRLVQRHTSEPLHQAITSHLLYASTYRVKDENIKSDLMQIAKIIKKVIHPLVSPKNRDEIENFALDIKSAIRKAESGQEADFDGFEHRINVIQAGTLTTPSISLMVGPSTAKEITDSELDEEKEMSDLKKRLRDAETLIKSYTKQIAEIQGDINRH